MKVEEKIKNIIPNINKKQMNELLDLMQKISYSLAYEMTQEEVSYAIESLDRHGK